MSKGLVFDIEEFAVHDGPGVRKLVFFKGCPLHCTWCHNPEGISFQREIMTSPSACLHCGKCLESCTGKKCVACGKCIEACPLRLRKICGREWEACDLAEVLLKGKKILVSSGGGITFSGGEPLAQPEFLFELIRFLHPMHLAVETCGHAPGPIFQKMIESIDLVIMDLKHTDPFIHKKYTGTDNLQIIKNLELLCRSATDFCLRIPLIPGVNDSIENLEKTALLVKGAGSLQRVELLPFHLTAGAKYPMVGKIFNPGFDPLQPLNNWKNIFKKHNIKATVL